MGTKCDTRIKNPLIFNNIISKIARGNNDKMAQGNISRNKI